MAKEFVSYVEDAQEETGSNLEPVEGTRRYAFSEAPSSPYKVQPNTGKSRADKRAPHRRSESSSQNSLTDSDDTVPPKPRERVPKREFDPERVKEIRRRKEQKARDVAEQTQRKMKAEAKAAAKEREMMMKPVKKTRPTSLTQSKTVPAVQTYRRGRVEDPSCYGVQQSNTPSVRPRAQTGHFSYHAGQTQAPPIAHSNWHQSHQPPSPYDHDAYPPSYGVSPSIIGGPPSQAQAPSYFDAQMSAQHQMGAPQLQMSAQQQHAHLKNRFERPSSAIGYRAPSQSLYGYEDYEEEPVDPRVLATRRPSRSKKQQNDDDRRKMPPPDIPRPKSALPPGTSIPYRPPPPQLPQTPAPRQKSRPPAATRRGVGFVDIRGYDDEDFEVGGGELFNDASPDPAHDRRALARTRRPSVAYEQHGVDIVPAGRRSKRNSFYGNEYRDRALGTGGVSLEDDRYLDAMKYQDDVNGGPTTKLTAETLRKASHRGGGSRGSTRSSGSQEDSEYKRSNTTGITRSSSGETDNVTIKVTGSAVVRVQGAEIECIDGGEITLSRAAIGGSRWGSERASTVYQIEDARSRVERKALPHRARAPSQSDSQTRSYAPSHAPYDPNFSADDYI